MVPQWIRLYLRPWKHESGVRFSRNSHMYTGETTSLNLPGGIFCMLYVSKKIEPVTQIEKMTLWTQRYTVIQASLSQNCNNYITLTAKFPIILRMYIIAVFLFIQTSIAWPSISQMHWYTGGQLLLSIEMQPIHFYIPLLPINIYRHSTVKWAVHYKPCHQTK